MTLFKPTAIITATLFIFGILFFASATFAQTPEQSNIPADLKQEIKALNQFGEGTTVPILLGRAVRVALGVVGTIALVMFVYGGVLWMTAGGNSDRVQHAGKILVWSGLGIVVIVASVALADFLFEAFR